MSWCRLRCSLFYIKAILQHKDHPVLFENRCQQGRQEMILHGLPGHNGHIAFGHLCHVPVGPDPGQVKVSVLGFHHQAVGFDVLILAVEEEMDLAARPFEACPIEAAQGPSSKNCVTFRLHRFPQLERNQLPLQCRESALRSLQDDPGAR